MCRSHIIQNENSPGKPKINVLHIDITDHYPVTLAVGIHGPGPDERKVDERTNHKYVDYKALNSVLSSLSWERVCGAAVGDGGVYRSIVNLYQ
ncbi:hypothetical protein HHI36_006500 [Cryptolaemus montrouzieri]|uniref:Uncharacterized protein n=1 Tax=Cryptolaemus montrouzieri TaxID=559131 RepID=A0ABD2NXM8_9CUCU